MSIVSVNNSPNPALVSTVSGVDQAQPSAQTVRAKQLLEISMLETQMNPIVSKLEGYVGASLARAPQDEEDFFLGVPPKTLKLPSTERGFPSNTLSSTEQRLEQLIRQLSPDPNVDPFPSPSSPLDLKLGKEFSQGMKTFWSDMVDTFEERSGKEAVQHDYDRDMSFLLNKASQLNKTISGMNSWSAANKSEQLHDFVVREKTRIESQYERGMSRLDGVKPNFRIEQDVAVLGGLTERMQVCLGVFDESLEATQGGLLSTMTVRHG